MAVSGGGASPLEVTEPPASCSDDDPPTDVAGCSLDDSAESFGLAVPAGTG